MKRADLVVAVLICAIGIAALFISLVFSNITGEVALNGRYSEDYLLKHPPAGWSPVVGEKSSTFLGVLVIFTIFTIAFVSVVLIRKIKEVRA